MADFACGPSVVQHQAGTELPTDRLYWGILQYLSLVIGPHEWARDESMNPFTPDQRASSLVQTATPPPTTNPTLIPVTTVQQRLTRRVARHVDRV